jgi:hypothetical protein
MLALSFLLLYDLMNISLSLFFSTSLLDFLSITCISFTPNQVYYLVHICHQVISLWFHKCLPVTNSPYSALVLTNLTKYPMWCPFIPTHAIILSRVTSCTHLVRSI